MNKVSIVIVTWNSMRYIFDCLESLMRQSFRDFSVLVVDNASEDGTVDFLRSYYPEVSILQNFKNFGYSKANNQGIKMSQSEYVLIMNPDVILEENFLERLINFADQHPQAGSFGGKILRLFSEAVDQEDQAGLRKSVKSDIIDSTGLQIFKSRRVINRGEGQKDNGQYESAELVFGHSGACVIYRKDALESIALRGEYFDNDFFAYKEDIDLAWRLKLYGWTAWYLPTATCYHHRKFSSFQGRGFKSFVKNRQSVSKLRRATSLKNHHLMLVKNDQLINIVLTLPWLLYREIWLVSYALIFELFQWKSLIKFFKQLPAALLKRQFIMSHKKVAPLEIRKWFK